MKPSVGRIVHYVSYGPGGEYRKACRAAIVTEVDDLQGANADLQRVGLMVANPTGQFFHSLGAGGCANDESDDPKGGTWHWPERVE